MYRCSSLHGKDECLAPYSWKRRGRLMVYVMSDVSSDVSSDDACLEAQDGVHGRHTVRNGPGLTAGNTATYAGYNPGI